MKYVLSPAVLAISLALTTMRAVAAPDVEMMSDIEVSEYAVKMSSILQNIQHNRLCSSQDVQCVRDEFARNGVSYDDKKLVQKRLVLIMASVY